MADTLYTIVNAAVLPGWLLLIFAPRWKWTVFSIHHPEGMQVGRANGFGIKMHRDHLGLIGPDHRGDFLEEPFASSDIARPNTFTLDDFFNRHLATFGRDQCPLREAGQSGEESLGGRFAVLVLDCSAQCVEY
jgi:hypothetical protein